MCAVRRRDARLERAGNFGALRIEDQEHLIATAKENIAAFLLRETFKPEHVLIEMPRRSQVFGIENSLKNA
jgi:hypothetical protein